MRSEVAVYGGVDLPAEGGYEIQVRAVDDDDRDHVGMSQPIQAARPLSS